MTKWDLFKTQKRCFNYTNKTIKMILDQSQYIIIGAETMDAAFL